MFRYYLHKLFVFSLSMVLALSIVVLSFSVLAIGLFHSDAYVESRLNENSGLIIESINKELENTAEKLSLDKEMFVSTVTQDNIGIVTKEVAHNFIFGYNTSFANSTELYTAVVRSINNYIAENGTKMSDDEISRTASLAVDSVNEALSSHDTQSVRVFTFVRSRGMMVIITVSALLIIACVIALDFLNNGRHRKFNYIGMGIATAGAVNISATTVISVKKLFDNYHFCSFEAYDRAVKSCFELLFNILAVIGVILFIAGVIMLFKNYRYFYERKQAYLLTHSVNEDKTNDYMENYYTKNVRNHVPGEEFEKDVKKIDFEDE